MDLVLKGSFFRVAWCCQIGVANRGDGEPGTKEAAIEEMESEVER